MNHAAAADLLSSRDLRRTAIREKVLSFLIGRGRPLSHAELLRMIGADIDRVTLYRTLETLQKAGLLHQVLGEDGVSRYGSHDPDAPSCPGNHPHFLCRGCGQMLCLSDQAMPHVTVPEHYTVKSKRLVVSGLCAACQGRRSRRKS
jgi:Fur family transcriptional regulator, ferric uptake regulator